MTNFEKIKSMSIGELVEKLDKVFTCEHCPIVEFCGKTEEIIECEDIWEKWLKSEVEE